MTGPLAGLKVVEVAGFGPAPMAGMMLADHGAAVTRIERPQDAAAWMTIDPRHFVHNRGKTRVTLDLKRRADVDRLLDLLDGADAVMEGFRPGVAERIGFGPDIACARNPRLIYARITGWGQDGPLAQVAAHDINVIAAAGVLAAIGPAEAPAIPLNLVGDFGGGAMYAVFGILAALHERRTSGLGQVVDVAMAEGALSLMANMFGHVAAGRHAPPRGGNLLDGGLPWYGVYLTADGGWMSVGALEAPFFANLMMVLGLDAAWLERRDDPARHDALRSEIAHAFFERPLAEWVERFDGVEACVAPLLEIADTASFPQFASRRSVIEIDGVLQPGIAPRFSRSTSSLEAAA